MPIDFANRDALAELNDIFNNPTGWGSGVIAAITAALGTNNPFNSAALADTGDATGNVPVLGANGISEAHLNAATTADAGVVRTAEARTSDAASGGFPLVMAASLVANILQTSRQQQGLLFNVPTIIRATSSFVNVALPTEAGIVFAVGSGNSIGQISTTFEIRDSNNIRSASSFTLTNAESFGGALLSRAEIINPGDVFRLGLRLRGFGRLYGQEFTGVPDFTGTSSDVLFGFKVATSAGMQLRIRGGGRNTTADIFDEALFVLFPFA